MKAKLQDEISGTVTLTSLWNFEYYVDISVDRCHREYFVGYIVEELSWTNEQLDYNSDIYIQKCMLSVDT